DLARPQGERDVAYPWSGGQVPDLEERRDIGVVAAVPVGQLALDLLPDDALDDLLGGHVGQLLGEQTAAVAQDRDPVRDPVDLVHPVRDVDDGDTAGLEPLDEVE